MGTQIFDDGPAYFLEDKLGEDWQGATVHCVCYHAPLNNFLLVFVLGFFGRTLFLFLDFLQKPDSCSVSCRHSSSTASSPSTQAAFQGLSPVFLMTSS